MHFLAKIVVRHLTDTFLLASPKNAIFERFFPANSSPGTFRDSNNARGALESINPVGDVDDFFTSFTLSLLEWINQSQNRIPCRFSSGLLPWWNLKNQNDLLYRYAETECQRNGERKKGVGTIAFTSFIDTIPYTFQDREWVIRYTLNLNQSIN